MTELDDLAARARDSAFIDQSVVELVLGRHREGQYTERTAITQLTHLIEGSSLPPETLGLEWNDLMEGMKEESTQWQRIAETQYRQGFYSLHVATFALLLIVVAAAVWAKAPPVLLMSAFTVAIAAVGLHSFLVFRLHQQARLAAERLSEKRAASLFLRLALSRASKEDAPSILATAAAMFLGHYAASTVPLQSDDFRGRS